MKNLVEYGIENACSNEIRPVEGTETLAAG